MAGDIMLRSEHTAELMRRDEAFIARLKDMDYRRRDAYLIGGVIGGFIGVLIGAVLASAAVLALLEL